MCMCAFDIYIFVCVCVCVCVCVLVFVCVFFESRVRDFFQIFEWTLTLQNSQNSYFSQALCVAEEGGPPS